MNTYPDPVPRGHGVYCLVHPRTASIYVGSSTDLRARAYVWHDHLRKGKLGHPAEEWEFRVIERTEGMTYAQLRAREDELLQHVMKKGMTVLNKVKPAASCFFTVDGLHGSLSFHAARKGMIPKTVRRRLDKGMTIEEALSFGPTRKPPKKVCPACGKGLRPTPPFLCTRT